MQRFVHFTLKQRVVINLLFVLLIVIGAFALLRVPVDRYPNIHFGKMTINTYFPGGSPEEVETLVTQEIEDALQGLEGIDYVRSASYRERSHIVIKFIDDSDYRNRFDNVRIRVLSMINDLPALAEPPEFNFLDVGDWFPAISVNISGRHTNATLALVAEEIKIPLENLPGVSEVKLQGEYTREFHLLLDPNKLARYGLTFPAVAEALRLRNISVPAGHVLTTGGEFTLRVDEQLTTRSEVLETIIRTDADGSFIRMADIASDALLTYREPLIMASINGEDCVTLQVQKKEKGNTLRIADLVRKKIEELQPLYGAEGITLTVTQDSSIRIKDSMRVLGTNLLLGTVLVCGIIWVFMGVRNAALTTIGIPFAFLVTLIFMAVTGNSINEVSLFAFVLVSGIIVDDAIVVVENIYRHIQAGRGPTEAIVTGTAEVFLPVVSATLTTVAAFLPMLLMTGMVGDFFSIIPITIVFSLIASLLECLVILPCHYLEFGHRTATGNRPADRPHPMPWQEEDGRIMRATRSFLNALIRLALRFRLTTQWLLLMSFAAAILLFILSFQGRTNLIRIQFFPDNYSLYYIELFGPPGTSIYQTHDLVKTIAAKIHSGGAQTAESALGFAGYYIDEDFTPHYGATLGHVAVTLPPTGKRHFADYPENDVIDHLGQVRTMLDPLVPANFRMMVRPEKDGPPVGKDITIRVLGTNSENVARLAERVNRYLLETDDISPWLTDLSDDQGSNNRLFRIRVLPERAAELGLDHTRIARLAASVVNGEFIGTMQLPDEQIDLIIKVAQPATMRLTDMLNTPIIELPQGTVKLGDICSVEYAFEPGILNHFQNQRSITLTANITPAAPVSPASVVNSVDRFHDSVRQNYPGATLSFAGEYESTRKSFLSLSSAFVLATLLMYLILTAQFKSYLQPLIIISAVVFALTGVIFGTFLSRTLFTINSFVAVIGVAGVVVNDALVLVAFLNASARDGLARREALLLATNTRLRPILLTTLTTTLGLLPMALGIPEYSNVWGSMAMTFVTGLCTATLLTIVFVPVQWDLLADLRHRTLRRKKAAAHPRK